jgi:hypothetical protein
MEFYTRRVNTVRFYKPTPDTLVTTATLSINGGTAVPLTPVTDNTEFAEYTAPYLQTEGEARVTWTFSIGSTGGTYTETQVYQIVTPLLAKHEIKEIHPNATDAEIDRIEKATRHIIQAHTGQRFGKYVGTNKIQGSASRKLLLPERLLELHAVDGVTADSRFGVQGDGYILTHYPWGVPPVKADAWGLHYHTGGVIHNPNNVHLGVWNEQKVYEVNGVWGGEEVPGAVKEAAKLLINDYACADNTYRDRYLTSMTAADWRIQFNSGAFAKTGNVRADQLLSEYVLKRGWAVI